MKRIYSFTAFLFSSVVCFSQLSVTPSPKNNSDNYIFAKGSVLFVSDEIHLEKNTKNETQASIYLRNGSQLIQGTSQKTPNTGNGLISVFQKGNSNAFDYDYWAAPVGNNMGENGLFGISMLHAPKTATYSIPALTTTNLNGISNPLSISDRWIYTFTGFDYMGWHFMGATTTIPAGYGFSMKGVNGTDPTLVDEQPNNPGNAQRYDFRGRPNSGNIQIPILPQEMVLIGNPYPSSFDLSLFLTENSATGISNSSCYGEINRKNITTGIAYFWDSKENGNSHYLEDYMGGYGTFSPVDPCTNGIYEPPIYQSYGSQDKSTGERGKDQNRRFLPIGQGFIVQGSDGGMIELKNSHRVFRNEKENTGLKISEKTPANPEIIPKVRLEVTINNEYVRGLSLGFWPNSTSNVDHGMDAVAYDQALADIGWSQNDDLYVVNVRPFIEAEKIPLILMVEEHAASFKIILSNTENFDTNSIFLFDSQSNIYHNIKSGSFEITLEPGVYKDRFSITFTQVLEDIDLPISLIPEEDEPEEFSIFQNNYLGELEILSTNISSVKSVGIFNLLGKRMYFRSNFGNRRSISINTQHLSNAVYIVKITDSNNQIRKKKILVFNKR